jgi:hypothetical protein
MPWAGFQTASRQKSFVQLVGASYDSLKILVGHFDSSLRPTIEWERAHRAVTAVFHRSQRRGTRTPRFPVVFNGFFFFSLVDYYDRSLDAGS